MKPFTAVVFMGIFSAIFGCSKRDEGAAAHFVSEARFQDNLARQVKMTPETMAKLREYRVAENDELKLEVFFYTDGEQKARLLTRELQVLGYDVQAGQSTDDPQVFFVTGWTTPIRMSDSAVVAWIESMCRTGHKHDCEFDGWGTNPEQ